MAVELTKSSIDVSANIMYSIGFAFNSSHKQLGNNDT